MFESLQILGFFVLAVITLVGLGIGVVLAICARRKKLLRRRATVVISGAAVLLVFEMVVGFFMFREFCLNERLVEACHRGDIAEARWLLSLGASPNANGVKGMDDAIGAASQEGHRQLVELLLSKGARVGHIDFRGKTALQRAKESDHADIVMLLEQAEDSQ